MTRPADLAHLPSGVTEAPVAALCLLCRRLDDLVPFYVERMELEIRRREPGFVQFHGGAGMNLCLWEIGHIHKHIGYTVWPEGDRTGKVACTVRLGSVADVDALYARLRANGVAAPRPPRFYSWNAYAFYFADPDGNCWEIYHWPPDGPRGDVYQAASRS